MSAESSDATVIRACQALDITALSACTAIASGDLAAVTGDVEKVTGHRPLSLADVLARG